MNLRFQVYAMTFLRLFALALAFGGLLTPREAVSDRPVAAPITARAELLAALELQVDARPRAASAVATLRALAHALLQAPSTFDPGGHLLTGARYFRAGRFEAALVELRLVERAAQPPPELGLYLGPTLYKLGRFAESLEAFASIPPGSIEPLADYYHALAAYDLRLYRRARELFGRVAKVGGPKLGASSAKFVAEIDRLFSKPVGPGTVDAYLEWTRQAVALKRPVLARIFLEEARELSALAGGARAAALRALEPGAR